ncbi:RNA-directed RNA polymerase, variant 2 [Coprinopsis cinerea AmutBmut pab1-1]|nr:RNA-directed RNA polymerase [Coprinopsis cinerea AmutBmut pab1-1]KAG2022572.1 RNA-directed RNA polymerase, variant 2 [Coprinopsis cinerea AmutBmut pab1-1]
MGTGMRKKSLGDTTDSYSDLDPEDQEWWEQISSMSEESLTTPLKGKQPAVASSPESPTPMKQTRSNDATFGSPLQGKSAGRPYPKPLSMVAASSVSSSAISSISTTLELLSSPEKTRQPPLSRSAFGTPSSSRPTRSYTIRDTDSEYESTDVESDISPLSSRGTSMSTIPSSSESSHSIGSSYKGKGPVMPLFPVESASAFLRRPNIPNSSPRLQKPIQSKSSNSPAKRRAVPSVATVTPAMTRVEELEVALSKLAISDKLLETDINSDVTAVQEFLSLPLGEALEPHFIVEYNPAVLELFDRARVEWGTQWELARGVLKGFWTWEDVMTRIPKLVGSNTEIAPNVPQIMGKSISSGTSIALWKELDREEKATREAPERRLGLGGSWEGVENWHGGQVQQVARLVKLDKRAGYKVSLEPMENRRSHRFARYVGSRHILQLKVSDKLLNSPEEKAEIIEFLSRKFVLLGRVFVPFHTKDESVYMVETNENYDRTPQKWCADHLRLSFIQFMEWHNPMIYNFRQAISKFVTRFALGLSNSVPTVEFEPDSIFFIDDIYSADWPKGKPGAPAEKTMTDGCGFINLAALRIITKHMGYEYPPTGIQGRIDGAKGMWIRHPTDESPTPRIWIRASQNKIKNPCLDRAHRIFELLGPSRPYIGSALSQQTVLNFHHNGITAETLIRLFEDGLKEDVMPLLDWNNMVVLWNSVAKAGGLTGARNARIAASASRALGFQRAQWKHEDVDASEDDDDEDAVDSGPATYTGRNPYSGAPLVFHEKICAMLQAGFRPQECMVLQENLKTAIKTTINTAIEKYRIPLKESVSAFVIPDPFAVAPMRHPAGSAVTDPLGVLKEGEIYYRSSQPMKDPETDLPFEVITGPVVVGRYPLRLPSDLQKVTAVDVPELAGWTDVVIFSARGKTNSLASLLSGGDMDGDVVHIFKESPLVEHFENKSLCTAPDNLMDDFESEVEKVVDFCKRMLTKRPEEAAKEYLRVLLGNLKSSRTGLYSMFHDNAVANLGYAHPEAIRLAYIFNTILDASKSGLRLKQSAFDRDQRLYGRKPDAFGVLKELKIAGRRIKDEMFQIFNDQVGPQNKAVRKDSDLLAPYNTVADLARRLKLENKLTGQLFEEELERVRRHVEEAEVLFGAQVAKQMSQAQYQEYSDSPSKAKASRGASNKSDQDDIMLAAARKLREPIPNSNEIITNLEEVKASCAYSMGKTAGSQFAWSVAFSTLLQIKAKARNINYAAVLHEFDDAKNVSSGAVRALSKASGEEVF